MEKKEMNVYSTPEVEIISLHYEGNACQTTSPGSGGAGGSGQEGGGDPID